MSRIKKSKSEREREYITTRIVNRGVEREYFKTKKRKNLWEYLQMYTIHLRLR